MVCFLVAALPLPWVPEVQVSKRLAEDAYLPLLCPTPLAQSPLASPLSRLHWYMAWNGVTPTRRHATFNRPSLPRCFSNGLGVSPTKVLLENLGSLPLPLLQCSYKLPIGPRSSWNSRKWTGRLASQNRNNTSLFPYYWLAPVIAKIRHTAILIEEASAEKFSVGGQWKK